MNDNTYTKVDQGQFDRDYQLLKDIESYFVQKDFFNKDGTPNIDSIKNLDIEDIAIMTKKMGALLRKCDMLDTYGHPGSFILVEGKKKRFLQGYHLIRERLRAIYDPLHVFNRFLGSHRPDNGKHPQGTFNSHKNSVNILITSLKEQFQEDQKLDQHQIDLLRHKKDQISSQASHFNQKKVFFHIDGHKIPAQQAYQELNKGITLFLNQISARQRMDRTQETFSSYLAQVDALEEEIKEQDKQGKISVKSFKEFQSLKKAMKTSASNRHVKGQIMIPDAKKAVPYHQAYSYLNKKMDRFIQSLKSRLPGAKYPQNTLNSYVKEIHELQKTLTDTKKAVTERHKAFDQLKKIQKSFGVRANQTQNNRSLLIKGIEVPIFEAYAILYHDIETIFKTNTDCLPETHRLQYEFNKLQEKVSQLKVKIVDHALPDVKKRHIYNELWAIKSQSENMKPSKHRLYLDEKKRGIQFLYHIAHKKFADHIGYFLKNHPIYIDKKMSICHNEEAFKKRKNMTEEKNISQSNQKNIVVDPVRESIQNHIKNMTPAGYKNYMGRMVGRAIISTLFYTQKAQGGVLYDPKLPLEQKQSLFRKIFHSTWRPVEIAMQEGLKQTSLEWSSSDLRFRLRTIMHNMMRSPHFIGQANLRGGLISHDIVNQKQMAEIDSLYKTIDKKAFKMIGSILRLYLAVVDSQEAHKDALETFECTTKINKDDLNVINKAIADIHVLTDERINAYVDYWLDPNLPDHKLQNLLNDVPFLVLEGDALKAWKKNFNNYIITNQVSYYQDGNVTDVYKRSIKRNAFDAYKPYIIADSDATYDPKFLIQLRQEMFHYKEFDKDGKRIRTHINKNGYIAGTKGVFYDDFYQGDLHISKEGSSLLADEYSTQNNIFKKNHAPKPKIAKEGGGLSKLNKVALDPTDINGSHAKNQHSMVIKPSNYAVIGPKLTDTPGMNTTGGAATLPSPNGSGFFDYVVVGAFDDFVQLPAKTWDFTAPKVASGFKTLKGALVLDGPANGFNMSDVVVMMAIDNHYVLGNVIKNGQNRRYAGDIIGFFSGAVTMHAELAYRSGGADLMRYRLGVHHIKDALYTNRSLLRQYSLGAGMIYTTAKVAGIQGTKAALTYTAVKTGIAAKTVGAPVAIFYVAALGSQFFQSNAVEVIDGKEVAMKKGIHWTKPITDPASILNIRGVIKAIKDPESGRGLVNADPSIVIRDTKLYGKLVKEGLQHRCYTIEDNTQILYFSKGDTGLPTFDALKIDKKAAKILIGQ